MHFKGCFISNCTPCNKNKSTNLEKQMNKKQQTEKSKRELLFMLPIDKSMSVDEVYLKLIELMKEKGIKIYPDEKEVN
tara:strand:- start:47 stop:280 length:234 start_codon:yes stop_codon:yes gene_type:complete